MPIMKYL